MNNDYLWWQETDRFVNKQEEKKLFTIFDGSSTSSRMSDVPSISSCASSHTTTQSQKEFFQMNVFIIGRIGLQATYRSQAAINGVPQTSPQIAYAKAVIQSKTQK